MIRVAGRILVVVACLAACSGALAAPAVPPDWASCPSGVPCEGTSGVVDVDAYDDPPLGEMLDAEIQCAIDCLDGLPAQDHHALGDANGRFLQAPAPIPGGVLRFSPGTRYLVQGTLYLPFGARGQVIVEGRGARLEAVRTGLFAGAILAHQAPTNANACDIDKMARACDRWIIRDLVFAPSPESTSWSAGIYGIRLEAATAPIVSNVRFEGVGFGVLLSEVRQGVVEGSTFSNCTRRDIMIEDRGLVAACSGRGSSFSLPLGYSVPVSEAGSANCTVRDTRHFRELPGTTAISIRANGLTTIQNAEFVGAPSSTFISRELPARPATSLMTIRDCAFELSSAPPAALISNRVAGMVVIENLELGDSPPGPLYSVAQASGATMTVFENIPALPTGWTIAMADACDDAFQFFNVVSEVPVTDPSLWSGGLVAPILTVDSAGLKKLPSAVSGCPTPALQPGMMRFDATGHLKGRTSARDVQFHSGVQ